jgi:hypothetical protein
MSETGARPVYHGMRKHVDRQAGYAVWLPSDWQRYDLADGRDGALYTPHPDRCDTCLSAEKRRLEFSVRAKDMGILREGFREGLDALPGVEVETQDEAITSSLLTLEARFTFLEGEARRKRWVRVVYWGNGQLILIAQGATPEEFDYWLPMFYNTMMTVEL